MSWIYAEPATIVLGGLFLILTALLLYRFWRARIIWRKSIWQRLRNHDAASWMVYASLLMIGVSVMFITLSYWGPAWGESKQTSRAEGVDVLFVLDVSQSMKAQDMVIQGQTVDRLSAAKQMMANFVIENTGNRYGLVVFAGDAFVTTPLTFDTDAFLIFLNGVTSDDVAEQGTNLGMALEQALGRLGQVEEERGQVMVLVTDGGDEVGGNYGELAKILAESGVRVVAVGMGNEEGVPIPEGQDVFGRLRYKTYQGETVLTTLNEKPLKEIADATDGRYINAETYNDMKGIQQVFEGLKTTTMEQDETVRQANRYQWFLLPALISFIGFVLLQLKPRRKI